MLSFVSLNSAPTQSLYATLTAVCETTNVPGFGYPNFNPRLSICIPRGWFGGLQSLIIFLYGRDGHLLPAVAHPLGLLPSRQPASLFPLPDSGKCFAVM